MNQRQQLRLPMRRPSPVEISEEVAAQLVPLLAELLLALAKAETAKGARHEHKGQ